MPTINTENIDSCTSEEALELVPEKYREHLNALTFALDVEDYDSVSLSKKSGAVLVKAGDTSTYHYKGYTITRDEDVTPGYYGAWRCGRTISGGSLSEVLKYLSAGRGVL